MALDVRAALANVLERFFEINMQDISRRTHAFRTSNPAIQVKNHLFLSDQF